MLMFTASEVKNLTVVMDSRGQPVNPQPLTNLSAVAKFRPRNFRPPVSVTITVSTGTLVYVLAGGSPVTLTAGQDAELVQNQYLEFRYYAVTNGSFQILYEADVPLISVSETPRPDPLPAPLSTPIWATAAYVDEKAAELMAWLMGFLGQLFTRDRVTEEYPTGEISGSNTNFFTAHPFVAGTTQVYLNGIRQSKTGDYSEVAPNQLVFDSPPVVGDKLFLDYSRVLG